MTLDTGLRRPSHAELSGTAVYDPQDLIVHHSTLDGLRASRPDLQIWISAHNFNYDLICKYLPAFKLCADIYGNKPLGASRVASSSSSFFLLSRPELSDTQVYEPLIRYPHVGVSASRVAPPDLLNLFQPGCAGIKLPYTLNPEP